MKTWDERQQRQMIDALRLCVATFLELAAWVDTQQIEMPEHMDKVFTALSTSLHELDDNWNVPA